MWNCPSCACARPYLHIRISSAIIYRRLIRTLDWDLSFHYWQLKIKPARYYVRSILCGIHSIITSTKTIFFAPLLDTLPPYPEVPPITRLGYLLALARKSWNCLVCDSGYRTRSPVEERRPAEQHCLLQRLMYKLMPQTTLLVMFDHNHYIFIQYARVGIQCAMLYQWKLLYWLRCPRVKKKRQETGTCITPTWDKDRAGNRL